jgi:hypothetical protein
MAAVYYRSLDDAEVIEVEFLTLQGNVRVARVSGGSAGDRQPNIP